MTRTFLDAVERHPPEAPAVSDATESLSYGALLEMAASVACVIADSCGTGGYILLKAPSTARFVATLLGVMYSGNTPVPIDPTLPDGAVGYMRDRTRAAAILDPDAMSHIAAVTPVRDTRPDRPALVMFTSGTSGFPKGVIMAHGNILHSCATISAYLDYHTHRRAAVVLPLHYSYALLSQVCCYLFVGGRVHLFSGLRNPLKFARTVAEHELETFCGVPSTFHALSVFHEQLGALSLTSIRVVCSAGAPVDLSRYQTIKTIFPNCTFFNNYGMTEATPRIAYVRDDDPRFAEGTCGRPIDGVEIKIVGPERFDELPDGTAGLLVVRGANVTPGYVNDEEATRQAFTPDGFLISGDIAYRDENGYLFIRGRADDMFNSGGEKIAPLEIERVLNGVAGVELSAVAGIRDRERGMTPVAFVKLQHAVTRATLVGHLARELPLTKIPRQFFEVTGFPMTPSGKLQRRLLSPDDRNYVVRELR